MMLNKDDIIIEIIGDAGPFSAMGRSIGYRIMNEKSSYLIDCGAPIFQILGFEDVKKIKGIIGTHSHEDHKRWFTDISLYMKYFPGINRKLNLLTDETIQEEFYKNSKAALERSLSIDSRKIIDIPYSEFINQILIGPRANYKIQKIDEGKNYSFKIFNNKNECVAKNKAKIFINPKANRPRMLFYDESYKEWIEPESFYPFSNSMFYEKNKNIYKDDETDLSFEAVKSTAWHGVPTISIKVTSGTNEVLFTSDTCYDLSLWKNLYETKYNNVQNLNTKQFKDSSLIFGNINDYIERIWSKERYNKAMEYYKTKAIIHDVAGLRSVVHTDYPNIKSIECPNLLLTHTPDTFVSIYPLVHSGKKYILRKNKFYEIIDEKYYELNADAYCKKNGNYFLAYKSAKGKFNIIEYENELLDIRQDIPNGSSLLFKADLYYDLTGQYFKINSFDEIKNYRLRADNKIEYVKWSKKTSTGTVKKSMRNNLVEFKVLR